MVCLDSLTDLFSGLLIILICYFPIFGTIFRFDCASLLTIFIAFGFYSEGGGPGLAAEMVVA